MPQRIEWDAGFASGDVALDGQHRALLALCNRLADHCQQEADAGAFDLAFAQLKTLAREHFDAEARLLAGRADPEALEMEREEFDYLVDEVATTANFDRLEVQRFVALWCLGHVRGLVGAAAER